MRRELDSSFQKTPQVNGFNTIREREREEEINMGYLQGILRRNSLKGRQVSDVLVVEPFDFEVQIHVLCALA